MGKYYTKETVSGYKLPWFSLIELNIKINFNLKNNQT